MEKEKEIKRFNYLLAKEKLIKDSREQVFAYERLKKIIPKYAEFGEREKYIKKICDKIGF